MIPKIIHFIWVGSQEKSELLQNCISSWKKFCPEYQIIEWGNDCLAKIENQYVKEAAEMEKWAFVSDYIRLLALKEMGGFYFDTDLEITNNLDEFRSFEFITGFEKSGTRRARPVTALMGACKNNSLISNLLDEYNGLSFVNDGVLDLTPNTDRITRHFRKNFRIKKWNDGNSMVVLREGCVVFPYFYFCTPKVGKLNYGIHHFNGSWRKPGNRKNIGKIGKWRLVKFSFELSSVDDIQLDETEKLIYVVTFKVGKRRSLALIGKNSPV